MKTIGLVGGMSWESSRLYYELINRSVSRRLGGFHSAPIILYSVDFAPIEQMQREGRWSDAAEVLAEAALAVERAGAELLLLGTNTMHKVAPAVQARLAIPLLHIADVTAAAVTRSGVRRVGLLATRFTMEETFYVERLVGQGLEVVVPEADDRQRVHRVIYEELCRGRIEEPSRAAFIEVVRALARQGAEAVILGCTEIGLLLQQQHSPLPLYDSTTLHAEAAVDAALA